MLRAVVARRFESAESVTHQTRDIGDMTSTEGDTSSTPRAIDAKKFQRSSAISSTAL